VYVQEFSANPGRQWMDGLLQSHDGDEQLESSTSCRRFVDVFRWLHPNATEAYTNWCTVTGARATNYGCRLDYIIADIGLVARIVCCDIMADIEGSDHCPVRAQFDVRVMPAMKCPPLCTKYLPQFAGWQQTLATFFGRKREKRHELQQSSSQGESQTDSQSSSSSSEHLSQGLLAPAAVSSSSPSQTTELSVSDKCSTVTKLADRDGDSCCAVSTKKPKLSDNRQSSLLAFFNKPSHSDSTCREPLRPVVDDASYVSLTFKQTNNSLFQELANTDAKLCNGDTASKWKMLLKGPPQPPLCKGHNEPCVLRTVKKDGPNKGKQFWVCCKPEGQKNNPQARCDHFVWVSNKKC